MQYLSLGRHRPNGGTLGCPCYISGLFTLSTSLVPSNSIQFYFFTIVSGYSTGQRGDHEKYNSVYSMTGLNADFGVPNRSDPWEARVDPPPGDGHYGHARQESAASDTAMFDDNPFDDPPREVAPAGKSNLGQYDSYRDPYYVAGRP